MEGTCGSWSTVFVNLSLLVGMAISETIKKFGRIVVKAVKRFAKRQRKSDLLKLWTTHTVSENGRHTVINGSRRGTRL